MDLPPIRTVVDLDRMLTDPAYAETLIKMGETFPGHVLDQLDAARRNLMSITGGRVASAGDVPQWMRLQLLDTVARHLAGKTRTCVHPPDLFNADYAFSALWKPDLVVCGPCGPLLKAIGAADRTCDHCGEVVEGENPIWSSYVAMNSFVLYFGLCWGCVTDIPVFIPEGSL